ncbi:hypothetical protein ABPG73_020406 [Tetrahymena malaccensis]
MLPSQVNQISGLVLIPNTNILILSYYDPEVNSNTIIKYVDLQFGDNKEIYQIKSSFDVKTMEYIEEINHIFISNSEALILADPYSFSQILAFQIPELKYFDKIENSEYVIATSIYQLYLLRINNLEIINQFDIKYHKVDFSYFLYNFNFVFDNGETIAFAQSYNGIFQQDLDKENIVFKSIQKKPQSTIQKHLTEKVQITPQNYDILVCGDSNIDILYVQVNEKINGGYKILNHKKNIDFTFQLRRDSTFSFCIDQLPISCSLCASGYKMSRSYCFPQCKEKNFQKQVSGINNRQLQSLCGNGFYWNGSTCTGCDSSCQTCSAGTNNDCLSCASNLFFKYGQCVLTCGTPQILTVVNYLGQTVQICSYCANGLYWFPQNSSCVPSCQVGFYVNKYLLQCSKCDNSCYTCSAGTSNDCLTCPSNLKFKYGQCVSNCDNNQTIQTTVNNQGQTVVSCINCHLSCKTCSGVDQYSCTSCNSFYYELNTTPKQCVQYCENSQYLVPVSPASNIYTCQNCLCESCDAKGNCLLCPLGLYYDYTKPSTNPCVTTCTIPGTYNDVENRICTKCYDNCLVCDSDTPNGCKVCSPGYQLGLGQQCIPIIQCGSKQWFDGLQCVNCIDNCDICFASDTCSICNKGYAYNTYTQKCEYQQIKQCPTGQYFDSHLMKQCVQCPSNCLSCSSASKCNQYKIECHYTCQDCFGTTDNACSICPPNRNMESYFVDKNVGICRCSDGYSDYGSSICKRSKSEQIQYTATGVELILQSIFSSFLSIVSFSSIYFQIGSDYSQYLGQFSYFKRHNLIGLDRTLQNLRYYNFNLLLRANFGQPHYESQKRMLYLSTTANRSRYVTKIEQIHQSYSFFTSCFSIIILDIIFGVVMVISRFFKTSAEDMPQLIQEQNKTKWKIISYFQLLIPSHIFSFTVQELSLCIFMQFHLFNSSSNDQFQEVGLAFAIIFFLLMIAIIGYQLIFLPKKNIKESLMIQSYFELVKKEENFFAARFYGIQNAKKVFYSFLIVVAYEEPLVPIIFMFFGEIVFTSLIIYYQPYCQNDLNILTILIEAIMIIITLIMFIMIGQPENSSVQLNGVFGIVVIFNSLIIFYCIYCIYLSVVKLRENQFLSRIFPEQVNTAINIPNQDMSALEQDYLKNNTNFISYTNNYATQLPQYTDINEPKAVQDYQNRKKMLSNINRKKLINYEGIKQEHELSIQNQQKALKDLQLKGKLYQQQQLQQNQQYYNQQVGQSQYQQEQSVITQNTNTGYVKDQENNQTRSKTQQNKFFQKSKKQANNQNNQEQNN